MANHEDYSDLEVAQIPSFYGADKQAVYLLSDTNYDNGKIPTPPEAYGGIEANVPDGIETLPQKPAPEYAERELLPLPSGKKGGPRMWFIMGGIALLLVVLGGVLGGVLGAKTSSKSTSSTSATAIATSNISATPLSQLRIAAVSYDDGTVNNTRLYYQDASGQLIEATSSSADDATWTVKGLGIIARNGSAISAAVTRPGQSPMGISLFYMDEDSILNDYIYNSSDSSWTAGNLHNQGFEPYPQSDISGLYDPCQNCTNYYTTLVAFQDTQGVITIGNQTDLTSSWETIQASGEALGTRFCFQNNTDPPYPNIRANLWYQNSENDNIKYTFWNQTVGWSNTGGVSTMNELSGRTPIAASASRYVGSNLAQEWINVLTLTNTGIRVDTWGGRAATWVVPGGHPSAMQNSTSDVKTFGDITLTARGQVFAVMRNTSSTWIESWQMQDDLYTWNEVGVVTVAGANVWDA